MAVDPMLLVVATLGSCLLCLVLLALCRIWRRNRYYKKVQVSLDEEERAFQETLARSYQDDASMDAADQQKLQMLEAYLHTQTLGAGTGGALEEGADADYPTKVEDVDRFMADLAAAAAENAGLTPAREDDPESGK